MVLGIREPVAVNPFLSRAEGPVPPTAPLPVQGPRSRLRQLHPLLAPRPWPLPPTVVESAQMDLLSLEEAQGLPSKVRTTEYSSWGRRCPSTLSSKQGCGKVWDLQTQVNSHRLGARNRVQI